MAFQFNRGRLVRLGRAVGIGSAIAACIISANKILHNKAEWQDWLIVGSCSVLMPLVSAAALTMRFMGQIDTHAASDDRYFHYAESEMSYMTWHSYMAYRNFAYYRVGIYPSTGFTDSLSEDSLCPCHEINSALRIAPSAASSTSIQNCQDLGILDTEWAELCALKAEQRYLKYLKRGISPQSAYRYALTHASASTTNSR